MSVLMSLRMLFGNLPQGELLFHLQRYKLCFVGIRRTVGNWISQQITAEYADGDRSPFTAEIPAQLLLGLDNILEGRFVDLFTGGRQGNLVGPHILHRGIDLYHPISIVLLLVRSREKIVASNLCFVILAQLSPQPCG